MATRPVSAAGMRELFAQNSGHVLLALVAFRHDDLSEPVRIVNDMQSLTYGGNNYIGLPFQLTLPTDTEDEIPAIQMTVDNVDRQLVELLRTPESPPGVDIEVVRVDEAGTVTSELGPLDFSLLDAKITAAKVTLKIGYLIDVLNEPATGQIFNPSLAPGLFR